MTDDVGGRALPTGTVTFLFSDIEGSTALLDRLGTGAYEEVLSRHREILRAAFAGGDGVEVGTEGDSLFVVFADARSALAAAVSGQRGLHVEPWPDGGPVRVRMGLHTGIGILDRDGAYVGPDVHRAARVSAAGHGGQVVVSETTRALVDATTVPGATLRDLGQHRLKDLRPERLYDLVVDGLPADFPPLRSVDARPNNLPIQLTTFVGRERELEEAGRLLGTTRLLTLTGPGGTGKTRLSLQLAATVAEGYPDGVFFIALETITDPGLVPATIARAIGIRESGNRTAWEMLAGYLPGKRLLLVLDNFEQVVAAAPVVADILRVGPAVDVVVTSRAVLRVSGEQEYPVPGLPTPVDPGRLTEVARAGLPADRRALDRAAVVDFESVRLFVARAAAAKPGFALTDDNAADIARICERLAGMPLAIELAAARIRVLSPEAILARLDRQLEFLATGSRDLPARQQTLRGAITWSHDLLSEPMRELFERLSVFMGGFDLASAEAVAASTDDERRSIDVLEGLSELADQSLIRTVDDADETRFTMLESIREFAAERLAGRGETDAVRERHATTFLALAEAAGPHLSGDRQREWLERLEREHENLRVALIFAVDRPLPQVALRLLASLWRFWQKRGYLVEARGRAERILAEPWARSDTLLAAKALEAAGGIAWWQGDPVATRRYYAESLDAWRAVGDLAGVANALYNAGLAADYGQDRAAEGLSLLEEAAALYRELGDEHGTANVLWGLSQLLFAQGDRAGARRALDEAVALFHASDDRSMESWALHMSGLLAVRDGDPQRGLDELGRALRQFHASGDVVGVTLLLVDIAVAAETIGQRAVSIRLRAATKSLQHAFGAQILAVSQETMPEVWGFSEAARMDDPAEQARLEAEGAALTLDEAIDLALSIRAGVSPASAADR